MKQGLSIDSFGNKTWFKDGQRHRIDGPDIEYVNGEKRWYINGEEFTCKDNEEFLQIVKLKVFL